MHNHEFSKDVGSTKLKALEEASKALQQKLTVATQSDKNKMAHEGQNKQYNS